jgi:hypothetical protein
MRDYSVLHPYGKPFVGGWPYHRPIVKYLISNENNSSLRNNLSTEKESIVGAFYKRGLALS